MPDVSVQASEAEISYQNEKKRLLANREKALQKLEKAQIDYDKIQKNILPRKELRLERAKNVISIHENSLSRIDDKLRFLRPRNEADISYRQQQCDEFADLIKQRLPHDFPLRFHGCPIYAAEKIIKSGEISSSVDRIGVETSYDGSGQISVTTGENLYITVQSYTDLSYDYNLPAGCIFVVTPESLADEKCGDQLLMGNVHFKDDPQRLVAVITTPENLASVRHWLGMSGLNPDKGFDFDGFVSNIEKIVQSVRIPYRALFVHSASKNNSPAKSKKAFLEDQISAASQKAALSQNGSKTFVKESSHDR